MRLSFPITKFEKQADGSLLVAGLATDETLDSQGDILDYEGSKAAFGKWRGNVREAHDPKKPVGKRLGVTFDDARKAIEVEAFISAGAPDTIKKIEDGVLASFSVGGSTPTKARTEKVGDRMARRVLEWEMTELSVVDVGANPNANITLVKADGTATEALASDVPAPLLEATNRFAAALLGELKKGKAPSSRAEDVEEDDAAPGTAGPQSEPATDPPAEGVEPAGAAPGTAAPNGAVAPTESIPASPAAAIPAAEVVTSGQTGTPAGPQSAAPTAPPAAGVEPAGAAPGTAGAQSSAPASPTASSVAEGAAPANVAAPPAGGGIEGVAEIGGSDTEEDMIAGGKKRDPVRGTPITAPPGKADAPAVTKAGAACSKCMKVHKEGVEECSKEDLAAVGKDDIAASSAAAMKKRKAAVRALVTKYLWGGEENDIADAAMLLGRVRDLYASEAAEGEDETPQLELLASALGALQRFIALEAEELEDGEPAAPNVAASTTSTPPDQSIAVADMALAADPKFTKALMPLVLRAYARELAQKFAPADAPALFKVNHGDQLAEGIGKGLSETNEAIAKVGADLRGFFEAEIKGLRKTVETIAKTAAVPAPLRTVPAAPRAAGESSTASLAALEAAGNGLDHPELRAKWAQAVAIAKASLGK
jgi:hypothetical protein